MSVWPIPGLFTTFKGHAFWQDRWYFSLAEHHKSKDTISMYNATNLFRLAKVSLTCSLMPPKGNNNKNKALSPANIF